MATEFVARNGLIVISGQIQGTLASGIVISGSIASGQASNFKLSSGAIISNIQSGSIISGLLANNSVLSGSIASGQIGQMHLSSGSVSSGQLANNSIASGSIASGQVSNFHLSSGAAIYNLQSGSIISGLLANNSVISGSIASGQIGRFHINSGSITNVQLANNSVISGSIASGQISNFHLSSGAAIYNIQSGSIISGLLANNSVISGSIASGQIGQFHLSSGSVSSGQLANNSVVSGSIASGQVSNFHLSSGAAIYNIQSGSIISGLLANNSVISGSIASGQIGQYHLVSLVNGAGYFVAGFTGSTTNLADKLDFSNDTTTAKTTANLSISLMRVAGVSENITKGYLAGGQDFFGTSYANADKLVFATDTTSASTASDLSQARYDMASCSGEGTKGYFTGGGSYYTTSDKITYSNDTTAAQTTADLPVGLNGAAAVTDGSTKGFFAGGYDQLGNEQNNVYRITYSTDTTSSASVATLSQSRQLLAGITGETSKGYFVGGLVTGLPFPTADKIVYSTEITSAVTTANLTQDRYGINGVSQGSTKGFVAGGALNTGYSAVADKITYTTDTTTAQTSADLTVARGFVGSVNQYQGTSSYSIYSGHFANSSVVSGSISANEIGQMHLASGCIRSGHMTSGSVFGDALGSGAVVSGNIASGQIGFFDFGSEINNNNPKANNFRVSVVSGVPITSGDLTARSTIYLNPYNGDTISLYDGSNWSVATTSGTSVSISTATLSSGLVYDVYCYNNAGVPALEFSTAWTNTTTRADSISFVDGVPLKSIDVTRRFIGTVYSRGSGLVDDSYQYRNVWNWDNRVKRAMYWRDTTSNGFNVSGSLNSRPWNNSSGSAIFWIQGYAGLSCQASMSTTLRRSAGAATAYARCDGITNAFVDFVGNLTLSATAEYKTATGPIQCVAGLNWFLARIGMSASGSFSGTEIRLLNVLEG